MQAKNAVSFVSQHILQKYDKRSDELKILQIIDVYKTGGAEKVFDAFKAWAEKNGIESECLLLYKSDFRDDFSYLLNKNAFSACGKIVQTVVAVRKLRKKVRFSGVERIVSFLDRSNIISICACAKSSAKVTVTVHNPPTIQYKKLGIMRYAVFMILRHFYNKDFVSVVAVSNQVKDSLGKIGIKNVSVVYNPLSEMSERSGISQKTVPETGDKIPSLQNPYFISVGRLSYQKAHWKMLKALSLLKSEYGKNAFLVIAGEGELAEKLHKLSVALGLEGQVIFTGFVKNPSDLIKNAFCMLFSSFYEGFPVTVLESFSYGIPVIGSRVALPEEIRAEISFPQFYYDNFCTKENFDADFFEPDDYELAKVMSRALQEKEKLMQIAEIGKNWVEKNCSQENFTRYLEWKK